MKRLALVLLATAGFGFLAGQQSNIQGPQRSEPAPVESQKILRSEGQPVETPLVEKLLPKKPDAGKEAAPALRDGQLSPRGQWRWSDAQWAWLPVKQAGPAWVQVGHHSATVDHLVNEHGFDRATVSRLSPAQRDTLHSNAHNSATRAAVPVRQSGCPGGNCPSPSRSRGLFRWR